MEKAARDTLFDLPTQEPDRTVVNRMVTVRTRAGFAVVWIQGAPWHRFDPSSPLDRRIVAALLVIGGLARPCEVTEPLQVDRITLLRDRALLLEDGIVGLASLRRGPKGPFKATPRVVARARRLHAQGVRNASICQQLGISPRTLGRCLPDDATQADSSARQTSFLPTETLPTPSFTPTGIPEAAPAAPAADAPAAALPAPAKSGADNHPLTPAAACLTETSRAPAETGPAGSPGSAVTDLDQLAGFHPTAEHPERTTNADLDRSLDRFLARFGWLTQAEPRFVPGHNLAFVGALLLVPALVGTGFFRVVESVYGALKNGFYGLRHTVMTLALMMALRRPRAEHLKGASPAALGRLLGLDRAPEVKTLRRRLKEIAGLAKADQLMLGFARHLAGVDPSEFTFLYGDAHVKAYYGKRRIPKAFVTQRRVAMRAASDLWLNDAHGEPVIVVSGQVTAALTKVLPQMLPQVRGVVGKDSRPTMVFDRGGWSAPFFREILRRGFSILTYRKGRCPRYPERDFKRFTQVIDGEEVSYRLRDGFLGFGGKRLRCVVRLRDDGKQTAIVTEREDLSPAEVAYWMFGRWRQENYFKYMVEEFALDALDTYAVEPDDAERLVPNPQWLRLGEKLEEIRKEVVALEAELGKALEGNVERQRPTTRGFKIAHAALRQRLAAARAELERVAQRRKRMPKRVRLAETVAPEETPLKLQVETRHFMNVLKMAVYRAETMLYHMLTPYFAATEQEGRALLREAFRSCGSLEISGGRLRVTLDPLSAPRRTEAIAGMCSELNEADVRIPGTSLRVAFAIRAAK